MFQESPNSNRPKGKNFLSCKNVALKFFKMYTFLSLNAWKDLVKLGLIFISRYTIVAGYYDFTLVVSVSVHLSVCLLYYCSSILLFPDNKLSECQWIFTKLGMCIDIVEMWFRIANLVNF